jgi:Eukaryotic aspartyl protease.
MQIITNGLNLSVFFLLASVLAKDGFYKMDFNLFRGSSVNEASNNRHNNKEFDIHSTHVKRDGEYYYDVSLSNQRSFYAANLSIGTPAQNVEVLVDTGSSDLWVVGSDNPKCVTNGGNIDCTHYGTFSKDASTSFKDNNTEAYISYMDDTHSKGGWGTDDISLSANLKLKLASIAVANDTDSPFGILGIAFEDLEVLARKGKKYSNVPSLLKEQGFINKAAYSLYITSQEASTGSILFGGVDSAKYTGSLVPIDIVMEQDKYVYTQIPLTSISVNVDQRTARFTPSQPKSGRDSQDDKKSHTPRIAVATASPAKLSKFVNISVQNSILGSTTIDYNGMSAVLDSGTTLGTMPNNTLAQLARAVSPDAFYEGTVLNTWVVPCSVKTPTNNWVFNFNNQKEITAPLSDLIIQVGVNSATNQQVCGIGFFPSDVTILGDIFLRSAYSVYNLDDKTVSLAQVKYSHDEQITVIE